MRRQLRGSDRREDRNPTVLYLVTNEFASYLFRGQLDFIAEHGFRVIVGCGSAKGDPSVSFDASAEVVRLPFLRQPAIRKDIQALMATILLIGRVRPQIVNASTPKASVLGMIAAKLCRVPVRVLVVRGFRFETTTGLRRRYLKMLDRIAAKCATNVVFNSSSLRVFAVEQGVIDDGRGELLGRGSGNGVDVTAMDTAPSRDEARQVFGLKPSDLVIGFVGRLTTDKGIDDLLWVYHRLRRSHPELRLLISGPFEKGDAVSKSTADRIRNDAMIIHREWQYDVASVYRAIDILIFPSLREGLPNAPLEAQLFGVPVVAYSATGTVDAIDQGVGGTLIPVGDRDGMIAEIDRLLEDPDRRQRMGEAGSRWVADNFARDTVWAQLVERYRRWTGVPAVSWKVQQMVCDEVPAAAGRPCEGPDTDELES